MTNLQQIYEPSKKQDKQNNFNYDESFLFIKAARETILYSTQAKFLFLFRRSETFVN